MKLASSEARNSAAFATSHAVPIRPRSGTLASRSAATSARLRLLARARETAGIRQGFQARRDIDAVAEDVIAVDDDVTEVDPDPEPDPAVLGHRGLAIDHRPLQLGGTADRVDDAREFHQYPVAGRLDDAAGMLADLRIDELAAMRLEAFVRAFLVRAHQTRVARHIGG